MQRALVHLAAALLFASAAFAAPPENTKVIIFGTAVDVPRPPDLVPLLNKESAYYRFAARLQSSNRNRLEAAYLPEQEAVIADIGQVPSPGYWGIAYVVGPATNRSMTLERFKAEVLSRIDASVNALAASPEIRRKIGEGTDASMDQLGRELKIDSGKLRMGEVTPLGTFAKSDSYVTVGTATRVQVERDGATYEEPTLSVIGFIVARERLLCIAVYRVYRNDKDIELIKRDSTAWIEAIAKANS